jgi:hypothetical protein
MFAAAAVPTVTAVPAVTLRISGHALATTRATAARSKRRRGTAKA